MSQHLAPHVEDLEVEAIELDLLVEAIHRRYGAEFRGYARTSLKRRVRQFMGEERVRSISELQEIVLRNPAVFARLRDHFSVGVTALFRDPSFYVAFRQKVVPHLWASPLVRVWCAGCATGEEVYSVAIVLIEEQLFDRARIYATDLNDHLIEKARRGIYEARWMQEYEQNYAAAGGRAKLSDYFQYGYDGAIFRKRFRRNTVFAQHNLATDGSFNEFNVILCRNVMIYFGRALQHRVHDLLHQSLRRGGFLCLGRRESLGQSSHAVAYEAVDDEERIYRRRR
ncbi:MAG: protein-glutamate O-methyltransferase CheR [Myxococcaceae bacterium]